MHIKSVSIQGFKTYKLLATTALLSPGLNVVVGQNGSGKSNFFAAIRFVLLDAYTHMLREERQGLLHEGAGSVMSAYVEIVFDNSDRRFPVLRDEVVVRRTVGLQKDDYMLDGRAALRSDVMNMLELAGFLRLNPYYIVPQGRITALTNAKDGERLELVKEVLGARVLELRLADATREMAATRKRQDKIDEMLAFIAERLEDLSVEKNQLADYTKLDRTKKTVEFMLLDQELGGLASDIEAADDAYRELLDQLAQDIRDLDAREEALKALREELPQQRMRLQVLQMDYKQQMADATLALEQAAEQQVAVNDASHLQRQRVQEQQQARQQFRQVVKQIEATVATVHTLTPQLETARATRNQLRSRYAEAAATQRALYAKQSRHLRFSSKAARDLWLQEQLAALELRLALRASDDTALEQTAEAARVEVERLDKQVAAAEDALQQAESRLAGDRLVQQLAEARNAYRAAVDRRKGLWREEVREKSVLECLDDEVVRAQQQVLTTMDRAQSAGIEAVRRIAQRLGLQGVHGPLGELFDVSDKYKMAAEVAAGGLLFHVVVDTDETASVLMAELERDKAGRVTFVPLNRVLGRAVQVEASDAVLLLRKLRFDPSVQAAMEHVFGRVYVVANLERGAELAKQHGVLAITIDGDRADTGGALSGGFRDRKHSRIEAIRTQQKRRRQAEELREKLAVLTADIAAADAEVTRLGSEVQTAQQALDASREEADAAAEALAAVQAERSVAYEHAVQSVARLDLWRGTSQALQTQIERYQRELVLPFALLLLADEEAELEQALLEVVQVEQELAAVQAQVADLELQIQQAELDLQDRLKPQRRVLQKAMRSESTGASDSAAVLALQQLQQQADELQQQADATHEEVAAATAAVGASEEQLAAGDEQQAALVAKLERFQQDRDRHLAAKATLELRRDEVQRKIRELGVLPEEAFAEHSTDLERLLARLNATNKKLAKYLHVNKKALEQYLNFTEQRDGLVTRRAELVEAHGAIEQLMEELRVRKRTAISTTFAEVAAAFTDVFAQLVAGGRGALVALQDGEGDDGYTGVAIEVLFDKQAPQPVELLLGGQKLLCAIALILAVQRCDPAPFYLFDEVDANLDAAYRTAVARVVLQLAGLAQFICTTFRPEMVLVAAGFYGVLYANKVSVIEEITQEAAMGFVDGTTS